MTTEATIRMIRLFMSHMLRGGCIRYSATYVYADKCYVDGMIMMAGCQGVIDMATERELRQEVEKVYAVSLDMLTVDQ